MKWLPTWRGLVQLVSVVVGNVAGSPTITIDGQTTSFTPGETVLDVANRLERNIPTLCWDKRLEPAGACRLCLVNVEGRGLPAAS